jgi:hypothetical protein
VLGIAFGYRPLLLLDRQNQASRCSDQRGIARRQLAAQFGLKARHQRLERPAGPGPQVDVAGFITATLSSRHRDPSRWSEVRFDPGALLLGLDQAGSGASELMTLKQVTTIP